MILHLSVETGVLKFEEGAEVHDREEINPSPRPVTRIRFEFPQFPLPSTTQRPLFYCKHTDLEKKEKIL